VYVLRDIDIRFSVRGSYAYSFADETARLIDSINFAYQIPFDTTHSNPQDQTHTLNIDVTYRATHNWTINTSYTFHTGWPATL
jgi:hypothetical protein